MTSQQTCPKCNPAPHQESQPHFPPNMPACFQPQAVQAPIFGSFDSNGRVHHGIDTNAAMIPINMIFAQQLMSPPISPQQLLPIVPQQHLMFPQIVTAQPHQFASQASLGMQHQSVSAQQHQAMSYQSPSISPRHHPVPAQHQAMFYQPQSMQVQHQQMSAQHPSMPPHQETFANEQVSNAVQHPHQVHPQQSEQVFMREPPKHPHMMYDPQIEEYEDEEKVESELERNLQSFHNRIDQFQELRGIWDEHSLVNRVFDQFLNSTEHLFHESFEIDKFMNEAGCAWTQRIKEMLHIDAQFTESYGTTKAFLAFFDEALSIMQEVESNANLQIVYDTITTFQAYVDFMLREDFDTKGELDIYGSDGWSELKSAVRAFKKEQLFTQGLSSLQTQPHDYTQVKAIESFLTILKNDYAFWKQNTTANRLAVWIEVVWEQIQLVKRELKKLSQKDPSREMNSNWKKDPSRRKNLKRSQKDPSREMKSNWKKDPSRRNNVAQNRNVGKGVEDIVRSCKNCLKFLKSDSFDSKGVTEFKDYESTRSLQIYCLKFKFMALPGFCQHKLNTRNENDRGMTAVRHRAKRLCSLGAEAYKMGEYWKQIVDTGAVNFEGAYMVLDHKTDDQNKQGSRKLQGILFYFILTTEEDSQNFLKLMIAFSEPKYRRDRVLRQFGDLYELQHDNLSPMEDEMRAKLRQNMLRKSNSMMPEKQFEFRREWDKKTGTFKEKKKEIKPTAQQVKDHQNIDAKIRDMLCADGKWSDAVLKHQRRMYHIANAIKEEDEKEPVESKQISTPPRIQTLRGPCAFMSAGC